MILKTKNKYIICFYYKRECNRFYFIKKHSENMILKGYGSCILFGIFKLRGCFYFNKLTK